MRRHLTLRLLLVLLLPLALFSAGSRQPDLVILHFNDFHSQILPLGGENDRHAGAARLVKAIRDQRSPNSLVLFAGDLLQGSPFSTAFRGETELAVFGRVIQGAVLGNHEFDYGISNLRALLGRTPYPVLAANVRATNGVPLPVSRAWLTTVAGVPIGIIGLVTTETPITTHPLNVEGLQFLPEAPEARRLAARLRARGARVVIALTHLGLEADRQLAREVPGLDLIVGGHTHSVLPDGERVNGVLIAQAGAQGAFLGRIELFLDHPQGRLTNARARLIAMRGDLPEDGRALQTIAGFQARLDRHWKRPLGRAAVRLDGDRDNVRTRETNLGNLLCDVMLDASGAEIALVNGGGIRAPIAAGQVTVADVQAVLPFANTLVTIEMPGSVLLAALARGASAHDGAGHFLQVSRGMRVEIAGETLVSAGLNGRLIEPARVYKVAVSDFIAAGGDGFAMFKNLPALDSGYLLSDLLITAFEARRSVGAAVEGRIIRR
jgi:2',3'-cyclic-nucleotide 2'-phosphodiesterase (5'-nucleotidase family)